MRQAEEMVLNFYLESGDYNGIAISDIINNFETVDQAKQYIKNAINNNKIELYKSETNPHIKHFDLSNKKTQMINSADNLPNESTLICLYPSQQYLIEAIGKNSDYLTLPPYKKSMAFGSPQLEIKYFRIDVLDRYLEDPRYNIRYDDYRGDIRLSAEQCNHSQDNIYLKSFGLAYNIDKKENLICAFTYCLARLTDRHQHHFYSYMEENENICKPDSDFYKNFILGGHAINYSIFKAFFEEIKIINKMTKIICEKELFKKDHDMINENRPEYFHPFLKPTKRTYQNFCRTLDKLFTENLDPSCIIELDKHNRIDIEDENNKKKSTLILLECLIKTYFKSADDEDVSKEVINIWKKHIRKERSKASHHVSENKYDCTIFQKYGNTMEKAYQSISSIRMILSTHPKVRENKRLKIPDWLSNGQVRNFFISNP